MPANDRLKDYVPVSERLERFYSEFPEGRVLTSIVEHNAENGFVLIRAEVYKQKDDALPSATGHAFENRSEGYVNKTSYIENCETSAAGRALALAGYQIKHGIASREEMQKVERMNGDEPKKEFKSAGFNSTDEALRNELFVNAEKLMAKLPEDKRKAALGRLVALPTEEMAKRVAELAEKAREKVDPVEKERLLNIEDIIRDAKLETITKYLGEHYEGRDLTSLSAEEIKRVHEDFVVPF